MIQDAEVREKLNAFLRDELALEDFDSWLGAHSWNMHRDSSASARKLVGAVELLLAEYSNGHRSRAELRDLFSHLANNFTDSIEITASGVAPFEDGPRLQPRSAASSSVLDFLDLGFLQPA